MLFDYDEDSLNNVMEYAKKMEDMTYNDILELCKDYIAEFDKGNVATRSKEFVNSLKKDKFINKTNAKGQLGNFIEKYYFGYEPNSSQEADLSKINVEIKQTPIDITKKNKMVAGERLSITMIPYDKPVEDNFFDSHLWNKIQQILLIHYLRDKSKDRLDYEIKYVNLFTPPKEDLDIIIQDYEYINNKIKSGKANEISEGDTLYLGACTKGATAAKSLKPQYYGNHSLAKRRNYCFKRNYMNYVLQNYILNPDFECESIFSSNEHMNKSFEDTIIDKISKYYEKSDIYLANIFNIKINKNLWSTIIYRILGIKGNKAKEFIKANIKIKTIRVEEDGNIKEHMPLPTFKFKEIITQSWEDSDLYNLLNETKYLFVFFYKKNSNYILREVRFWNMPYNDIQIVEKEWNDAVKIIRNGVTFTIQGNRIMNNLLSPSETEIIHIRPHTSKSAYRLNNGYNTGDLKNADQLPDGQWMTKQSFWINKSYLIKQFNLK